MNIEKISPGINPPKRVNVVIEIPSHANPVKYEVDKESGAILVDRFMAAPMFYPCNYGFIPGTLGEDKDPLDALVITPMPVINGAVIPCRPLGALDMEDESGPDLKVVCVPDKGLCSGYDDANSLDDISQTMRDQIKHFFEHYKLLEPGKWVKVRNWLSYEEAAAHIEHAITRYDQKQK